jgi:two-component system response regulator RegX3
VEPPYRILWISADAMLREAMDVVLTHHGFSVSVHGGGVSALADLRHGSVDVVLLHLGLTDMPGLTACRRFREATSVPLLVVLDRPDEVYRLAALYLGATEVIPQPVDMAYLLTRLGRLAETARAAEMGRGGLVVDHERHRVYFRNQRVDLTRREFQLIATLARARGAVVSREVLLDRVWGSQGVDLDLRTVDSTVARIRRKFLQQFRETPIETVSGVGYRLRVDPAPSAPLSRSPSPG